MAVFEPRARGAGRRRLVGGHRGPVRRHADERARQGGADATAALFLSLAGSLCQALRVFQTLSGSNPGQAAGPASGPAATVRDPSARGRT